MFSVFINSIPRMLLIKTINKLKEKVIKIKLVQNNAKIKSGRVGKILNQFKLELKRPKKHGELLG